MTGASHQLNFLPWLLALAFVVPAAGGRAQSGDALARKGNDYYKKENFKEAADCYRQALIRNPNNPLIMFNLGTALAKDGIVEDARANLANAAETPGAKLQRDAYYNMGVDLGDAVLGKHEGQAQPGAPGNPGQTPAPNNSPAPSVIAAPGGPTPAAASNPADDLKKKIAMAEQSLGAFRKSILTEPSGENAEVAKYNYETMQEVLRRLRQQQQQQQQQGGQQDKQQQNKQDNKQQKQQNQQDKQNQPDQQKQPNKDDQQKQNPQGQGDKQNQPNKDNQQKQDQQGQGDKQNQPEKQKQDQQNQPGEQKKDDPQQGDNSQGGELKDPGKDQQLKPEQIDALGMLNLLESEKPEQFKQLFRFRGDERKAQPKNPAKDW